MIAWYIVCGLVAIFVWMQSLQGNILFPVSENIPDLEYPLIFYPSSQFPMVVICAGIAFGYCWVCSKGAEQYQSISGKSDFVTELPYLFAIGYGLYGICAWFFLWGSTFQLFLVSVVEGDGAGFFAIIFGVIGVLIMTIINVFFFLVVGLFGAIVAVPFFTFMTLALFPFFFTGLYSLTAGESREAEIAEKHVAEKRPNEVIERELAEAMARGEKSDNEIRAMVSEMSGITWFYHMLTYKKKVEKYRKIRELMEAQTEAMNERGKMGRTAHEYERAKRR